MITLDTVKSELRNIVGEFGPDTLYSDRHKELAGVDLKGSEICSYRIGAEPACIIGVLLNRLGLDSEYSEGWEGNTIYGLAKEPDSSFRLNDTYPLEGIFEPEAVTYMWNVQQRQDHGSAWGDCL